MEWKTVVALIILVVHRGFNHLQTSVNKMQVIFAVIVAVLGWVVTHILTIRAQNKNFLNQVVNRARLEITRAIREYQDWLGTVHIKVVGLSLDVVAQEQGFPVDWFQKISTLREIFFADKSVSNWVLCLEEYEILFPETAECRKDLLDRQREIQKYLGAFLEHLILVPKNLTGTEKLKKTIEQAQNDVQLVVDQLAMMEDLRIYLQNRCLSSFTGNKIPERKPEDMSLPRLVQNKSGMLEISTSQN
jgi:hypothetical protein